MLVIEFEADVPSELVVVDRSEDVVAAASGNEEDFEIGEATPNEEEDDEDCDVVVDAAWDGDSREQAMVDNRKCV